MTDNRHFYVCNDKHMHDSMAETVCALCSKTIYMCPDNVLFVEQEHLATVCLGCAMGVVQTDGHAEYGGFVVNGKLIKNIPEAIAAIDERRKQRKEPS